MNAEFKISLMHLGALFYYSVPGLLRSPTKPKNSSTPALGSNLLFAPVNIFKWCIDRNNLNNLVLILVFLSINLAYFVDAVFKWRAKGANWFLVVGKFYSNGLGNEHIEKVPRSEI